MRKVLRSVHVQTSARFEIPRKNNRHKTGFFPQTRSLWPAVKCLSLVGTSYMIIIMYLNIVIISYYILLLLHYKHLQISTYIPIHHHTSPYTPLHRHIPLYIAIYPYTTPYTHIQHHIPPYITIHPFTSPYTPIQHHIPI